MRGKGNVHCLNEVSFLFYAHKYGCNVVFEGCLSSFFSFFHYFRRFLLCFSGLHGMRKETFSFYVYLGLAISLRKVKSDVNSEWIECHESF